jgi:EAL domain-containing protein (putative c-di-GMP-specific phosphodiesterase class I)
VYKRQNDSIQAFRRAGFGIALDDFGAGHASFDRLSHLEIDQLKIDRTLVQGMDTERGRKLVAGIVSLGRTLSMKVTAEGIETAEQAQFAKEANCDWGQGYLFGEAVPAYIAEQMAAQ